MNKPSDVLSIAPEDLKEPLTEEQKQEIEKYKESFDWSEPGPKKEEDKTPDPKDEEKKEGLEEISDEEPTEEEKAEEERLAKVAKEKGKTVEEVRKEEEAAREEESKKTNEQKETERLEAIAKEEGITVDEVKENEAKDKKVVENYGNDPVKIARALRKENSSYGKLKAQYDKLETFKREYDENQRRYNEDRVNQQLEAQRDKIVEEYIRIRPKEADEDEAVLFERAKVVVKEVLKKEEEKLNKETQVKADEIRADLVTKIPEEYKEYVPEIKEILKNEDNSIVMDQNFDVLNLCYYARGKKMTPEYVKSLEDAAYKRGKEQPEIVQKKAGVVSSSARSHQAQKSDVISKASQADRDRALEMFANKEDWSEEKKIEEYMTNHKNHDNW